ncbi:SIR2 family protein [Aeromonas sp. 2HA2]|uniref:SIR2 family protein n=1 Tax=Aeromonas sp. 2HA2 TaxID=2699194 RepID=UPI0023DD9F13|nr:SIR2 family protein [Aeromonas sp. 2HA2]MDF2407879.1 SIR2 family protein [Aeromonas sp. 2HA2]
MGDKILDVISKQAQEYYKTTPVIILGSGASAAYGMAGMWDLSQHLTKAVPKGDLSPAELSAWEAFCKLLNEGTDLESALHQITLSDALTKKVVLAIWSLLVPQDLAIFEKSLNNTSLFPLGKLLKHMLRSTIPQINIITPNYDRLAEYACEQEYLHHYTGFSHGYRGNLVKKDYLKCTRQVNIWKVHGSLGWFTNHSQVICALTNVKEIPDGLTPLIVTPGIEKYRSTHKEPYKTTIHEADDIIDQASSYLCVGFGFNDIHIQEKLINRCSKNDASIIVVTYKLSDQAKRFLFEGNCGRYLAIESSDDNINSRVFSSELQEPVVIDGDFWSLGGFIKLIM